MEYSGRRNRRGRRHCYQNRITPIPVHNYTPESSAPCSFLLSSLIMASLIGVIYLMLEYHCSAVNVRYDLDHITRDIGDIAKNLSFIYDNYYDLETKISKMSHDLPRIEGQIDIIDALAKGYLGSKGLESGDFENTPGLVFDRFLDQSRKLLNATKIPGIYEKTDKGDH